jgi:ubiquinone/menaquinone biosynthesis C-methylase UbiE
MRKRVSGGAGSTLVVMIGLALAMTGGCRTFDAEGERLGEVLSLEPGEVVADVGAGRGEWTLEMARRVGPSGRVFATEIDPERIRELRKSVAEAGLANVTVVEGTPDDTRLPPGCCDAILLRHVYHHLADPTAMSASLLRALRPGGFLAVIDFNPLTRLLPVPDGVPENRRAHGMPIDVLVDEMTTQGFGVSQRIEDWFRFDYCVVFRPAEAATGAVLHRRAFGVRVETADTVR